MHRTGWLSGLATVVLAFGVVAVGSASTVRIAVGTVGTLLVAAGIISRQRTWLAVGTLCLVLVATFAAMTGLRFDALLMMTGSLLVWDVGENTVSLAGQVEDGQVGRAAGIHGGSSLVVGAVAVGVGAVVATSPGIVLSLPALLLALLAITFLLAVFR